MGSECWEEVDVSHITRAASVDTGSHRYGLHAKGHVPFSLSFFEDGSYHAQSTRHQSCAWGAILLVVQPTCASRGFSGTFSVLVSLCLLQGMLSGAYIYWQRSFRTMISPAQLGNPSMNRDIRGNVWQSPRRLAREVRASRGRGNEGKLRSELWKHYQCLLRHSPSSQQANFSPTLRIQHSSSSQGIAVKTADKEKVEGQDVSENPKRRNPKERKII